MKKLTGLSLAIGAALAIAAVVSLPPRASAQTAVTTQVQAVISQVQTALNAFVNFGGQLVATDLNLAITDANANGNTVAATCWSTILKVTIVPIPTGAGIAWYKQRYLDLSAQYVNVNQSCATVAPLYVKLFNQFIQEAQSLNL